MHTNTECACSSVIYTDNFSEPGAFNIRLSYTYIYKTDNSLKMRFGIMFLVVKATIHRNFQSYIPISSYPDSKRK